VSAAIRIGRGDTFISYPQERLARRHLVIVTRVAKDHSWADIAVTTWAVAWSKRQPLVAGEFAFPYETFGGDSGAWYAAQMDDHDAMLAEQTKTRTGTGCEPVSTWESIKDRPEIQADIADFEAFLRSRGSASGLPTAPKQP